MDRDTMLARFEREYQEPNSITADRRVQQGRVLAKLHEQCALDALTPEAVLTFIGSELSRGLSPNTCRKKMGMIRSFVGWAEMAQVLDPVAAARIKSLSNPRGSSGRSRPNPYKMSEIRRFRELLAAKYPALPEYGRGSRLLPRFLSGRTHRLHHELWRHAKRLQFEAQIALALEAGLRRSEIFHLTIPAVHYDNDHLVVVTAKQGPGFVAHRTIPYSAHARTVVQEWLDFRHVIGPDHDRPWLQLSLQGGRPEQLRPLTFGTMAASLGDAFGEPWRWHRFRHTAATEWLRAGVPLEKVSIMMGHSTLEQTRAYTEILASDIDSAFGDAEAAFAERLGLVA